jgi:uncharacterized membrane protein (DUF4010 family)
VNEEQILLRMAVALAAGLVIGFERGWSERETPEGGRVAGLRTFGLIGLAGGLVALLAILVDVLVATAVSLALAGVLIVAWRAAAGRDLGATTEVGAVVGFALGALAGLGHFAPAMGGAVAVALLLGLKPQLHGWLRGIDRQELFAGLQLVLISVVILPLLPDRGYGPYGALNPARLWWMVVLVAGVSFAGYVANRLLGVRSGLLLSGAVGGLASSTAATMALARRAADAQEAAHAGALAGAIAIAWTMMFLRILVLVAVIAPGLARDLAAPGLAAMAGGVLAALWFWRSDRHRTGAVAAGSPLNLRAALGFAAAMAAVAVAAEAGRAHFGEAGLVAVATLSGLLDTDAISLSVAYQARDGLAPDVAAFAIAVACAVNTVVKAAIVAVVAPRALAVRMAAVLATILAAGAAGWSAA